MRLDDAVVDLLAARAAGFVDVPAVDDFCAVERDVVAFLAGADFEAVALLPAVVFLAAGLLAAFVEAAILVAGLPAALAEAGFFAAAAGFLVAPFFGPDLAAPDVASDVAEASDLLVASGLLVASDLLDAASDSALGAATWERTTGVPSFVTVFGAVVARGDPSEVLPLTGSCFALASGRLVIGSSSSLLLG